MDLEIVKNEREKLFHEMIKYDPTSHEYASILDRFNELTEFLNNEEAKTMNESEKEREFKLKESKMKRDSEDNRRNAEVKDKESKRGLIKTILTVMGSILGTVLVIFGEEFKLIGNKAWSTLSRYPK